MPTLSATVMLRRRKVLYEAKDQYRVYEFKNRKWVPTEDIYKSKRDAHCALGRLTESESV